MSTIPAVDVNEIIQRVLQERQGVLPPGSVSVEEIRAALQAQREAFGKSAPIAGGVKATPRKSPKTMFVPGAEDDIVV